MPNANAILLPFLSLSTDLALFFLSFCISNPLGLCLHHKVDPSRKPSFHHIVDQLVSPSSFLLSPPCSVMLNPFPSRLLVSFPANRFRVGLVQVLPSSPRSSSSLSLSSFFFSPSLSCLGLVMSWSCLFLGAQWEIPVLLPYTSPLPPSLPPFPCLSLNLG